MSISLTTPLSDERIKTLKVGDIITLSGEIFAGRDAVLPKLVALAEERQLEDYGISLQGGVVFHSAVSVAGVGPTSSNKLEIEASIGPLSAAGVKLHLGKGALKADTIKQLAENNAVFAVIPPVSAILKHKTRRCELAAFQELGMEALYRLWAEDFPAIIAAAKGQSMF